MLGKGAEYSGLARPTYSGVGVHVDSAVLERPDRPCVQCQVALRCQMEILNFSSIDLASLCMKRTFDGNCIILLETLYGQEVQAPPTDVSVGTCILFSSWPQSLPTRSLCIKEDSHSSTLSRMRSWSNLRGRIQLNHVFLQLMAKLLL